MFLISTIMTMSKYVHDRYLIRIRKYAYHCCRALPDGRLIYYWNFLDAVEASINGFEKFIWSRLQTHLQMVLLWQPPQTSTDIVEDETRWDKESEDSHSPCWQDAEHCSTCAADSLVTSNDPFWWANATPLLGSSGDFPGLRNHENRWLPETLLTF